MEDERRTGSWSIAHGIKQGTSVLSPKIWGNELEKDGAAWIAGKWLLPMLSDSTKPNVALDCVYVSCLAILTMFQ